MIRRLLSLLVACSLVSFAAFNIATTWDVRTTGSDSNGGAFWDGAGGTDRSQSDTPYQSYTDILIGATTTQGSSSAYPFDATTPGNVFNITGSTDGTCTVQRAQAVSQSGGVVTFDRSLGTAGSHCIAVQGGSLATIGAVISLRLNGNPVYIKSGTYTLTSTISLGSGASGGSFPIEGYNTTHGDLGTRPLITTATDSTTLFTASTSLGSGYIFRNLSFSNTATVRSVAIKDATSGMASSYIYLISCLFDGFSKVVNGASSLRPMHAHFYESEAKNSTANVYEGYGSVTAINSYFHDNTGTISTTSAAVFVARSLITNGTGNCIQHASDATVIESTIAGCTGDGITTNGTGRLTYISNLIYGVTGTALHGGASGYGAASLFRSNCLGGNGTDRHYIPVGIDDVSFSDDPFVDADNGDYSLNNTADAGAVCRSAGYPGLFVNSSTTGHLDAGAVQSEGSGGGGGSRASAFVF